MAHRLVPIQYAKSAADAEAYVTDDTGGQVIPISGKTTQVEGGWSVEVYSTDGCAATPLLPGKDRFTVTAVSACGQFVRIRDEFGIESDIDRKFDRTDLEAGDVLSGRYAGPDKIVDIFLERRADGSTYWKERTEFESTGGDGPGWTLGIATDMSTHNKS